MLKSVRCGDRNDIQYLERSLADNAPLKKLVG
jgi:hypothetical protein